MSAHFARPAVIVGDDGTPRRPTKGSQSCSVCGKPIERSGKFIASDGVRGQWRHAERIIP